MADEQRIDDLERRMHALEELLEIIKLEMKVIGRILEGMAGR